MMTTPYLKRRPSYWLLLTLGYSLCLLCLLLSSMVYATIDTVKVLKIGSVLDAEIVAGYPYNRYNTKHVRTVGIILRNYGTARTVNLEIGGDVRYKRTVSLPAQGTRRVFIYLPNDNISSYTRINVQDMTTGLSKHSFHSPFPGQYDSSVYSPRYILGRLEDFNFPINAADPWQELGSRLTADKMPDHWRGLTGVTALMLGAAAFEPDSPQHAIILDWVLMGGVLLLVEPTQPTPFDMATLQAQMPFQETLRSLPYPLWQVGLGYIALVSPAQFTKLDASFFPEIGLDFLLNFGQSSPVSSP